MAIIRTTQIPLSHIGDTSNYASFADDGLLTFNGTARVTQCYQFANQDLSKGGTSPDAAILGNYLGYSYDINDDSVFTFKLPDTYATGTDITIAIRWYVNEAYATASGEVKWQAAWSAMPSGATEAVDAPTHTGSDDTGDVNIPATAKFLTQTTIEVIPNASISAGDELGITIKRIAITDGNSPTPDPVVTCVGIIITEDRLGATI